MQEQELEQEVAQEPEPEQVFAEVGQSLQQIGGTCPAGWVVMLGQRPEPGSVAHVDGSWGEPPQPVPASCTRRQGRLALHQLGFLETAEASIAAIEDDAERKRAQIEYEADTWERSNAFVQQLWASLGGSSEGLDDAFRLAVTL